MKTKNTILVDICWTLFSSNTTFDFLDFIVQDKGYIRMRKFYSSWFGRRLNLLIYKLFHHDCQRSHGIKYLQGYTYQQLQQLAEQFYHEYLLPRRIAPVWTLLEGREIILVSGTLDIIAQTIASHLHASAYHASKLHYQDNICTGQYEDLLLTKKRVLQHYTVYDIITDNLTDIDLIRRAQHATNVTYNNQKRREKLLNAKPNTTYIHVPQSRY